MQILVYGGNGWIGSQFIELLIKQQIQYTVGKARVENIEDVEREIVAIQPTNIVSFIGRTHGKTSAKVFTTIDYLEPPGKLGENPRDNL